MKLTELSLKKPASVLILALAFVLIGVLSFTGLPTNLLPDITYPLVKVYVNWRGATPEEIEMNIAQVVEQKMATVDDLDYLDSQSTEGLYTLLVNFKYSADRNIAFQDVLAKMSSVRKNLPKDVDEPLIFKADPSQLPVMDLIITSDRLDMVQLRSWVETYLQPQFSAIEGGAGADVSGGAKREIRVYLDTLKMQALGIPINKVAQRLKDENIELAGGRVTTERKEFIVRTLADFKNVEEIKQLVIVPDKAGASIYLKDIATVKDTGDIQRVITRLNSKEGVKLSVYKQSAANTIQVEENIQSKLKELRKIIPSGVKIGVIYDQADYIRAATKGVRDAALIAALLVILVTWFFLGSLRSTVVIVLSMPVSILMTFASMKLLGYSINILSLGGLVLAITVILDQSVIVLENIVRIKEEKKDRSGVTDGLIAKATEEVAKALLFSVLTFIALFLPFLMIPGLVTLLFKELIVIVSVAILSSMLVALTITPLLEKYIGRTNTDKKTFGERMLDKIKSVFQNSLHWALKKRGALLAVTGIVFILCIALVGFMGSEFLPKADDGSLTVKIKLPTGTALAETSKVLFQIEKTAKDLPDIQSYSTLSGGRVWGLVTYESANEGEVDIQLKPKNKRNISTDKWVEKYSKTIQMAVKYPGAKLKIFHTKMKGIRQTGDYDVEVELHTPISVPIEDSFKTASKMMASIKDLPGLQSLDLSIDISKPEYQVLLNRVKISGLGLTASETADIIKTQVDGKIVTYYKEEGFYYPVRLVVNEGNFKGKQDIGNIPLFFKNGLIYLRDIAKIVSGVGPLEIDRLDQMRVIKVTASVVGADVGKTSQKAYEKIKAVLLPAGSFIRLGAQAQMMSESFKSLAAILVLALFFAYVILTIQFESLIWPLVVLIRIPLSLVGVVLALFLTSTPIGVTVLIGILLLSGIEVVHGVVLLTFIQQVKESGKSAIEAVVQGTVIRMRPVLMTLMVGIMGLVPLALGWGEGTELLKPMAIGVIGGLLFSLFLTFYFMPTVILMVLEKKDNR